MNFDSLWDSIQNLLDNDWVKIIIVIGLIFFFKIAGQKVITKIIRRAIKPDKHSSKKAERMREDTLIKTLHAVLKIVVWVFGLTFVLAQLGVNISPLIAGASIAGVAIGFGSQALVKDFVSGIFVILENQYRVGDVIKIGSHNGVVEAITIRQTIIRDVEGNKHFIPNGHGQTITNMSMDFSKLLLHLDVDYDVDLKKVQKVVNQTCQKFAEEPEFAPLIKSPPVFQRVTEFGAHSVQIRIQGEVEPGQQWSLTGELRLRLKEAFDKNGIVIPYQQLVVHKAKD